MAQWLITVPKDCDIKSLSEDISKVGGKLMPHDPIPLGNEVAVYADGEQSVAKEFMKLERVIGVFPHSSPEPF